MLDCVARGAIAFSFGFALDGFVLVVSSLLMIATCSVALNTNKFATSQRVICTSFGQLNVDESDQSQGFANPMIDTSKVA
jgi:hypothetical protein